tara:strand:- start:362 stop:628 length:267 start_codon:yes stop_codon:yes gene_type:complete
MSNQNQNQDPIVLQQKVTYYEDQWKKQHEWINELQKQNSDLTSAVSILKIQKVRVQVREGDHDDAIRDWLVKYMYDNDGLPDGLSLIF